MLPDKTQSRICSLRWSQGTVSQCNMALKVSLRLSSNLVLLLALLLSTLSQCASSEESLIIDHISSGRLEGPLSVTSTARSQSHRQLIPKEGDVSLLVVRVMGLDKSPSMDKDALFNSIFVKEASLRQQYHKCSAGKLNVVPTNKGVLQVRINMNINGADVEDVVNAADNEGHKQLTGVTSLRNYADLTMFVVPQGTMWNGDPTWTAYAVIDGKASVMNDDRANYLGVQMHELGHNFGLNHAAEKDDPFGDLTSHMSRALLDLDFPIKCFNAQNHWHLGWYRDRSISVDPDVPVKIKLLGFVDYTRAFQEEEFVVAKVGENLYLQFNRAKFHNRDTEEAPDKLVIVLDRGVNGTTLVAALDNKNNLYTVPNFENSGRQLNVEVCRTVMGGTEDDIDWMEVSIGYGSVCGAQLTTDSGFTLQNASSAPQPSPPSPRPTNEPSSRPTPRPTPERHASQQFDHVAGRFNWDRQAPGSRSPPTRVADRLNLIQEEVPDEESSGTVTFNNLVWYTMVVVATFCNLAVVRR
jgi:hypothetical protein